MTGRALPLLTWKDKARPRPYSPPKPPTPREIAIHASIADVLRRFLSPGWQWTHFPAGELREPKTAAKLKRMGLAIGWPDLLLLAPAAKGLPGGRLHAMEVKRQGEDLSDDQEDFAAWCEAQGVPHAVVCSVAEALPILRAWGCLNLPAGLAP